QVTFLYQGDRAALRSFRRYMADRKTRRPARETAIGYESTCLPEALRFDVARGIEHFLHARSPPRTFIANDHDVAGLYFAAEDAFDGSILAFKDSCRSGKAQNAFVDPRRLHDASLQCQIPVEDRKAAVLGIGMIEIADRARLAIEVGRIVSAILAECDGCWYAAR